MWRTQASFDTKMSIYGLTGSGERKLKYQVRLNASTTEFFKTIVTCC